MTDGRLDYTPDEALAHFAPDTHHRAVGGAQLDAERLRQCAVTSAFGLLAGGGGKGWSGNKCVAADNCRNSPLASDASCSRVYRALLS